MASSPVRHLGGVLGRVVLTMVVLAVLALVGTQLRVESVDLAGPVKTFTDPAVQRFVSSFQIARIHAALEVYRLEKGALPEQLEVLVDAGLLVAGDLRHPWREVYYYRRVSPREFVLLPPLR